MGRRLRIRKPAPRRPRRRHRVRLGRLLGSAAAVALLAAAVYGGVAAVRLVREAFPGPARLRPKAAAFPSTLAPVWTWRAVAGPSLPVPLAGASAAWAGGHLWLAGGLVQGSTSTAAIYRLAAGGFVPAGRLPQPSHDASMVAVPGGLVYAGGGLAVAQSHVWLLSPARGRLSDRLLPSLPVPLSDLAGVGYRHGVLLAGGYTGSTFSRTVWWVKGGRTRPVGTLPTGLRYAAAARLGSTLWLFGGLTPQGVTGQVWKVSLPSGRAAPCGHLPVPVEQAGAFTWKGEVVVVGGRTARGTALRQVLSWSPRTCRAFAAGRLAQPVAYAALAVTPKGVWLLGGTNGTAPALRNTWRLVALRPRGRG